MERWAPGEQRRKMMESGDSHGKDKRNSKINDEKNPKALWCNSPASDQFRPESLHQMSSLDERKKTEEINYTMHLTAIKKGALQLYHNVWCRGA